MKTIVLSLCTLTGVVDALEEGLVSLEVRNQKDQSVEYVSLTNEIINPLVKEGDTISVVVLAGKDTSQYCSK
tara:strand:- start:204 stop:419 length:216 start_codon:yes stop_codon:yes gene_type:complete